MNFEVEDETIRLITLLMVDFMAHGTRLVVECMSDAILSCITFGFLAMLIC